MHRRSTAFSLLELALVLLIVGTISAIALPRFTRSVDRYRAELGAKRVVADLDLARTRARHTSQAITVNFDLTNDQIQIPLLQDLDHAAQPYVTDLARSPYHAELVSADFNSMPTVTFNAYGRPSFGGTVIVEAGGWQRAIVLDGQSGAAAAR